jgi:hypothetical protein
VSPKRPVHLLIRFSDNLFAIGDVISRHQEVIQQKGSVWFGKLGTAIGHEHFDVINMQREKEIPSFLYLVKGNRRKSTFYKARIISLSPTYPESEESLIPQYYFEKGIIEYIKFWAKLSDIQTLPPEKIKTIKVRSSVLDIEETLFRSSAGHFLIQEIQ